MVSVIFIGPADKTPSNWLNFGRLLGATSNFT